MQHRFIVFVHKNGNTVSGLLTSTLNDAFKTHGERVLGRNRAIEAFPFYEHSVQLVVQALRGVVLLCVEVEVQHRTLYPVLLHSGRPKKDACHLADKTVR